MSPRSTARKRPELNLIRLARSAPRANAGQAPDLDLLRLDKIEAARARVATGFYSRPEVRRAVAEILYEVLRG